MPHRANQLKTNEYFFGFWRSRFNENDIDKEIRVIIREGNCSITHLENGTVSLTVEHPNSWHWVGERHLCWMGTPYYMLSANATRMVFGEFTNPALIGSSVWQREFERVEHF
jgi:hypothetical protein